MAYVVAWGNGERRPVSSAAELDGVLDGVAGAQLVSIYSPVYAEDDDAGALQLGVGHPQRSFLRWLGEEGGLGRQSNLPPWPAADRIEFLAGDKIGFYGPDRAMVTPEVARAAAREFVTTGHRPTNVDWTRAPSTP